VSETKSPVSITHSSKINSPQERGKIQHLKKTYKTLSSERNENLRTEEEKKTNERKLDNAIKKNELNKTD
jgi:hypothetical protein